MTAYYNEIDPYAAQWLRNLIVGGHIACGDVDERSIVDVRADDLAGYTQCHFFAGIGGWSYALRLAGWPDNRPVWTGSCPCQPFSQAGQLERFADERHLWPTWVRLIKERRPAIVFGEQVASATEWLRLVRGDLEALDYAVGCAPIEAASAGADHLRDRYWFVADADYARPQGRPLSAERAGERVAGPNGVADATGDGERRPRQPEASGEPQIAARGLRSSGDMGFANGSGRNARQQAIATTRHGHSAEPAGRGALDNDPRNGWREGRTEHEIRGGRDTVADASGALEWVIGADGKARRVKPGIRLLADGIPGRVGLLRGFGNAIDPRPAAEFIRAAQP